MPLRALLWLAIALPALLQLALLAIAIRGRLAYPYDLEWMEGGMLQHALRLQAGQGLYVAPSVDFIPYLYTPLYPALIALVGNVTGISYVLGRTLSVLALLGLGGVAVRAGTRAAAARGPALAGVALGLGLFAAAYPIVDGWYDLVRADALLLLMVTAPLAIVPRWARWPAPAGRDLRGHLRLAALGAALALAFFCKQTGFLYVAFGGAVVAALAWRRLPAYVAGAGVVGLGGVWLLERSSHGWFWIYASRIHRAHDFNWDRFWWSFRNILWRPTLPGGPAFPALGAAISLVVLAALLVVLASWWRRRALPAPAHALLLWAAAYAVSTVVGAIGWATEFAHFNAYMPAFLHGALAAGAAIPAVHACAERELAERAAPRWLAQLPAAALAAVLALTCWHARWAPARFVPTAGDVAAGDRLIRRLRALDGEVWMPSHPWYLHLAGKTPYVHRMGIKDVTTRQTRVVERLDNSLRRHAFAALVLDQRDVHLELPAVSQSYRPALQLPDDERPRLYSGARVVPDSIWLPLPGPAAPDR